MNLSRFLAAMMIIMLMFIPKSCNQSSAFRICAMEDSTYPLLVKLDIQHILSYQDWKAPSFLARSLNVIRGADPESESSTSSMEGIPDQPLGWCWPLALGPS